MKRTLLLFVSFALLSTAAAGACSSQSTPDAMDNPGSPTGDSSAPDSATLHDDDGSVPSEDGAAPIDDASVEQDSNLPPPPSKVDVTTVNFQGGSYILAVPKTYDAARSYPLVLVLHGDGENVAGMRDLYKFEEYSGDDAIVVYPSGTQAIGWYQASLDIDANPDLRFLRDLVAELKGKYNIDEQRVFGAGYSSGAFMVNFVACSMDMFRAIASNAGGAPYTVDGSDVNCIDHPIAAFVTHGADDHKDPDTGVGVDPSSSEWVAEFWASRAHCDNPWIPPTIDAEPPPCKSYNCPAEYPVTLCMIPGVAHDPPWDKSAEAAWEFFQKLP